MSRDWTPREEYWAEQAGLLNGRGDYWDYLSSVKWAQPGMEPLRVHSDEEIALRKVFPVLGKYLGTFIGLHERLSKYEAGIAVLHEVDSKLAEYIETGKGDASSYYVRWFEGELVESFHYRERNNELFVERICEDAMERSGKQYDAYMMYRADWMQENGLSVRWDGAKMQEEYLEDVKEGRFKGTLHQYEMEFGFRDGTLFYDSFDSFLEKQYEAQVKDVEDLITNATERSVAAGTGEVSRNSLDFVKE